MTNFCAHMSPVPLCSEVILFRENYFLHMNTYTGVADAVRDGQCPDDAMRFWQDFSEMLAGKLAELPAAAAGHVSTVHHNIHNNTGKIRPCFQSVTCCLTLTDVMWLSWFSHLFYEESYLTFLGWIHHDPLLFLYSWKHDTFLVLSFVTDHFICFFCCHWWNDKRKGVVLPSSRVSVSCACSEWVCMFVSDWGSEG